MYAEIGIILTSTVNYSNVIGLLEADSIPIVVSHYAILDDRPEGTIQENPRTPAAVQVNVGVLIAFNYEIFNSRPFYVIAADYREDCCGFGFVAYHAVGHERLVN